MSAPVKEIKQLSQALQKYLDEAEDGQNTDLSGALTTYLDEKPHEARIVFEALSQYINQRNSANTELDIVLDYGPKSHAIFGKTYDHKDAIQSLNTGGKKLVGFNNKLSFGPGYTIMDKSRIQEVYDLLDENEISYTVCDFNKYIPRPKTSFKKTSKEDSGDSKKASKEKPAPKEKKEKESPKEKKAPSKKSKELTAESISKMSVSDLKETLAKEGLTKVGRKEELVERLTKHVSKNKKAGSAAPGKSAVKAVKNKWGNMEEEETGLIFMELPTGPKGALQKLVVGIQNTDSDEKGVKSIDPLDEDMIAECETHKWRYLTQDSLKNLEKRDPKLHKQLSSLFEDDEDDEDDNEDDEDEEDSE